MAPTAISPPSALSGDSGDSSLEYPHNKPPIQTSTTESETTETNPIPPLRAALTSESTPLAVRFRALFSLKYHASLEPPDYTTLPAIEAIASAFPSPSALLKHELAYCLGQSGNSAAVPYLQSVVKDQQEDGMCRHEAAEALGALCDEGSLPLLREYCHDEAEVVRETCEIAVGRIEWAISGRKKTERLKDSDFASIDPAPPLAQNAHRYSIPEMQERLLDTTLPLFERYRAMFALRDLASPPDLPTAIPAVHALASGFEDPSALFRHEVAFVFGQLSHPASIPSLVKVLGQKQEAPMVRHEAAEALGSLGEEDGVDMVLRRYLDDEEQIVRDSVIVALDMAEFERSGQMEYAAIPDETSLSPMARVKA